MPADTLVSYRVYHESPTLPKPDDDNDDTTPPPTEIAANVIQGHFVLAENIFRDANFLVKLIAPGRPDPQLLTGTQADLIRDFLEDYVGPDSEEVADAFKIAATNAGIYDKDVVNVYYIDDAELTGIHLRQRSGYSHDIIIMGLGYAPESLAHELGHAFSLAHVNFWTHDDPDLQNDSGEKVYPNGVQVEYCAEWDYFDNECNFFTNNLMWASRKDRDRLTPGQIERMGCNPTSALIENGDSTSNAPECPSYSVEGGCPSMH
jgi:hypothetical protein